MLLILRGEIVVDHAGKKRKPDRKPAQQNDQRIAPQGKAQRLGFAGLCAEQPRGKSAQRGRGHQRHGNAPEQTAHAAKQAVIDE